ncbi:sodium- and chloride-dependent glycine transporter 2-like protein, partial [Dinothrombium tinctorium]
MQQTQEVSESKQNEEKTRENWSSKWEFLLSCVGLSVGIGNVWRFPYLAYKNGGGAFLIPYLIMLFLVGKPMYLMELVFGQFASTGTLSIWNCVPISKGIGAAMLGACVVVAVYYNVIMSYTLYFIGVTFQKQLPWSRCDPKWANGTNCFVSDEDLASNFTNGTRVKASELFWSFGIFGFLVGLPCVTRGGQYVINLMDYYGGGMTYLFIAVFEIITLSWIYGCKNLLIDIHFMLNKKLSWYWKVTWKFTAPLMLIFISIYSIFKHTSLQYGNYDYPTWADAIGWLILCAIIFQVPLFALIALFKQEKGDTLYEKLKNVSKPNDKWGPRDEQIKDSWRTFKLNYKFSQNQRELQSY